MGSFRKDYTFIRKSKLGKEHRYTRQRTYLKFRCDNCDSEFVRKKADMDPKRISNSYFHVCKECDSKRFAQKKGVERRKIWDLPASSTIPIGKI